MSRRARVAAAVFGLGAAALAGCRARVGVESVMAKADEAVLYAAQRVRTMDPALPVADALVVRGGKVVEVGSREALAKAHPDARMVQVPGVIVPGLVDAHGHLRGLGNSLAVVDLSGAKSEAEAVALVKAAGPESRRGDWIEGRGWDQNKWPGQQFPGRGLLDQAFPATPVALTRVDGHAAWVNGEALRRAGVTAATVDPEGGRFLRAAGSREPTGVLVDNAMDVLDRAMPELTEEQLESRLAAALARCAAVGLTGVHDAGMDLRTFTLLQQWDAVGRLPLRIYAMADGRGADGDAYLERGTFRGRLLSMRAVKFILDGALGSRGAALHEPYSDDPGQSGLLLWDPGELEARVHAFMERGFQVNIHAIGDRANSLVIWMLEKESQRVPGNPGRHRVEHAQVLRMEDIPRMAHAGLIASMQPTHCTSDMAWAEQRLGHERAKGAYAWRSVLDAKVPLAFGSDFPIESPEPLPGLYAARTRQDAKGLPEGGWFPEQRLSGEQALAAFTTGAAFASFAEGERGRLAPGMDADFTAVSVDPVEAPPMDVRTAKVLMTVVSGREVFSANGGNR